MSLTQQLLFILILIAISAFFSISEISLAAARRAKLNVLASDGDYRALQVLRLQDAPGHFFTSVQIGVNAVAILAGIFGESALTPWFKQMIGMFYHGALIDSISFGCSFVLITSLFILLADLVPKRLAMIAPEPIALRVVGPRAEPCLGFLP